MSFRSNFCTNQLFERFYRHGSTTTFILLYSFEEQTVREILKSFYWINRFLFYLKNKSHILKRTFSDEVDDIILSMDYKLEISQGEIRKFLMLNAKFEQKRSENIKIVDKYKKIHKNYYQNYVNRIKLLEIDKE